MTVISSTGTPIGTGVVPTTPSLAEGQSAISLVRYAHLIGYAECAFFGVAHSGNANYACREIWTKYQRDEIANSLAEAQDEIENVTGFPLSPKWIANEQQKYRLPLLSKYCKIIAAGVRAETVIDEDVVLNHAADPATASVATTLTSIDGIRIYYPDTDEEIVPSSMSIAGGTLSIEIPRCRAVKYELLNNPEEGLDYSTVSNFQATIDVKYVYTDPSTQATMVWPHGCSAECSNNGCSEYTEDACIYLNDPEIGKMDILPAEYSGGSWNTKSRVCCRGDAENVRINYYAGMQVLTRRAEMTILRLAHAKLPNEPCGCDVVQRMWRRDRNIPDLLTRERLNCPFGLSDGAWTAWRFAETMKIYRAGTMT